MDARIQNKPSQARLSPGTVLRGTYKVEGVYGEGGFAVVYKALQINLRRHVAIKVLNPVPDNHDGEAMVQRFLQEATAAANIRHGNVVMIHDVGFLEDRRPYIVMEPFEGHDLRQHLRKHGPLAPTRWLPLVSDCLGALSKAHEAGIIHRDIKPGNLVLTDPQTQDESLKLIDFGIARLLNEQVNLTMESQRIGTMRYMAPEYITFNVVSPAMDVFQMGLILVEGLTGLPVIQGHNDGQCVHMITNGIHAVPEALLASALGPVITQSLAHDHTQRFPHAGAMRAALSKVDPEALVGLDLTAAAPGAQAQDDSTAVDSVEMLYSPDTNTHQRAAAPLEAMPTVLSSPQIPAREAKAEVSETAQVAPAPGEQRARRPGWLVGLILTVALCLMVAAAVLLWGALGAEGPPDASAPAASADTPQRSSEALGGAAAPSPQGAQADLAAEDGRARDPEGGDAQAAVAGDGQAERATPAVVTLKVEPSHATIHLGDELVGTGQAQLEAPTEAGATLKVRVAAEGYEATEVSLSAPFESSTTVTLKAVAKAAKTPAPTPQKKPAASTKATPAKTTPAKTAPAKAPARANSTKPPTKTAPSASPAKPPAPKPVKKPPKPAKDFTMDIID